MYIYFRDHQSQKEMEVIPGTHDLLANFSYLILVALYSAALMAGW